jgi:hypothetical protein
VQSALAGSRTEKAASSPEHKDRRSAGRSDAPVSSRTRPTAGLSEVNEAEVQVQVSGSR